MYAKKAAFQKLTKAARQLSFSTLTTPITSQFFATDSTAKSQPPENMMW
jgi:hypothetical protein